MESISDSVFGYDYFVCHAWKDAHPYAEALVSALEPDLRCFIDSRDFEKGLTWTNQVARALRRSTVLIVVLSPGALSSEAVFREVSYFTERKPRRHVVTIDVGETHARLDDGHGLYKPLHPQRLRIPEAVVNLNQSPSQRVFDQLRGNFKSIRQNTKRTRILGFVAGILLLLFVGALVAAGFARKQQALAVSEGLRAVAQRNEARVEAGRSYFERAKQSAKEGVGTYPWLPIYANRALGFPMATRPPGGENERFPQLLTPKAAREEYNGASLLARWNLGEPVLIWASPLVRQHQESIMLLQPLAGAKMLSLDSSGYLRVWNAKTKTIEAAHRLPAEVSEVAASLDGSMLAVCSPDGRINLMNAQTLEVRHSFHTIGNRDISLSLDEHGQRISISGRDNVEIRRTTDGERAQLIQLPVEERSHACLLNAAGTHLAVLSQHSVTIYDATTGNPLAQQPSLPQTAITAFSWCGRSDRLFLIDADGAAYLVDVAGASERMESTEKWGDPLRCFVSSSGRYGVSLPSPISDGGKAMLWDLTAKKCLGPFERAPGRGPTWSVCFEDDDRLLYGGSSFGTITSWDVPSGKCHIQDKEGHGAPIRDVEFAGDGSEFVSAGANGAIEFWDATKGEMRYSVESPRWYSRYRRIAFVRGKEELLALDRSGMLVRLRRNASPLQQEAYRLGTDEAVSMALSPSREKVAVGFAGGRIELRKLSDLQTLENEFQVGVPLDPQLRILEGQLNVRRTIAAVQFSPGGLQIACGISAPGNVTDDKVCIIDALNGQKLHSFAGDENAVNAVAFSPTGAMVASGGDDGTVHFYDCARPSNTYNPKPVDGSPITALAYSCDGQIFAAGTKNGNIRLWDTTINQPIGDLAVHSQLVSRIAFSPDGTCLLSASEDGSIKEWELSTRKATFGLYVDQVLPGDTEHPLIAVTTDYELCMIHTLGEDMALQGKQAATRLFSPTAGDYNPLTHTLVLGGTNLRADNRIPAPEEPTGRCELWDIAEMKLLAMWMPHQRSLRAVSISRSGKYIATAGDDGVCLWNPAKLDTPIWRNTQVPFVETVKFTPDEKRIVFSTSAGAARAAIFGQQAGADARGNLFLADAADGRILQGENVADFISTIAISPKGDQVAVGTKDEGVFTYGLHESGFGKRDHGEQRGMVESLAYDSDGNYLASGSEARGQSVGISLWRFNDGMELCGQLPIGRCGSIVFSADHKSLWCASSKTIRKIDLRPIDYLKYFDRREQTANEAESADWFYVSGQDHDAIDRNAFLDRSKRFGQANLRGNTLPELWAGPKEKMQEKLFWRFCSAGNWPAAWTHFDRNNEIERTQLLLGMANGNFVPTAKALSQARSIVPATDLERETVKKIETLDENGVQ